MLTLILVQNPLFRDAIVSLSSGIKQTHSSEKISFYQRGNLIFAFSNEISLLDLYNFANAEYQPERIFIAEIWRSIDTEHEIGDIILPNVFLDFDKKILETELHKENQDAFMWNAKFLEIFDEHTDYYVENFGLTIGGIAVSNVPNDVEISDKLMAVYSADIYHNSSLLGAYEIITNSEIPALLLVGIIDGKIAKNATKTPLLTVAENILTTVRLLNEEENL